MLEERDSDFIDVVNQRIHVSDNKVVDGMVKGLVDTVGHNEQVKKAAVKVSIKATRIGLTKKLRFLVKSWPFIVAIIYMLSPVDIVPDAIPIIGNLDDLGVVLVAACNAMDRAVANAGGEYNI